MLGDETSRKKPKKDKKKKKDKKRKSSGRQRAQSMVVPKMV